MFEVHIYPTLCEALGTSYRIPKDGFFTKSIDLTNTENQAGVRLNQMAQSGYYPDLEDILDGASAVLLVQQPDTYGWFTVQQEDVTLIQN